MAVQIVMDPTGDTRHEFNTADASALAEAERRSAAETASPYRSANPSAEQRHYSPNGSARSRGLHWKGMDVLR
jgi:hypothetical protein